MMQVVASSLYGDMRLVVIAKCQNQMGLFTATKASRSTQSQVFHSMKLSHTVWSISSFTDPQDYLFNMCVPTISQFNIGCLRQMRKRTWSQFMRRVMIGKIKNAM